MLRLHARNPIFLTCLSAAIVVIAFTAFSGRFAVRDASAPAPTIEQVSVQRNTTPKLMLAVPRVNSNASSSPVHSERVGKALAQPLIAKSASIELLVTNVDVRADDVTTIAHASGGDVFSLSAQSPGGGQGSQSADATIRVPANAFDRTMERLASLGTVRARSVKAEDVTADVTDSSARLRNLQRTERDILKIMDRSGNIDQIMGVESQLSTVREQIETLQADLASMRGRVAYSTIDIHLEAEAKSAPAEPGALAQLKSAFAAAIHSLAEATVSIVAACIWLVVFAPYALAAAAAVWMLRLALRKYAVRR